MLCVFNNNNNNDNDNNNMELGREGQPAGEGAG